MNNKNCKTKKQIEIFNSIIAIQQTKKEYQESTNYHEDKKEVLRLFLETESDKQLAKEKTQKTVVSFQKETLSFGLYDEKIFIGRVSFSQIDTQTPEIEVTISENYRRKRIAYESIKKLTNHVISRHENIKYFIYRVRFDNIASIKLIEKLGGKLVETDGIIDKIVKTYYLYVL